MKKSLIITALISAFALSACGVKGDRETPPPLWGDKSKTEQPQETPAE